jgi:hypothetical protein
MHQESFRAIRSRQAISTHYVVAEELPIGARGLATFLCSDSIIKFLFMHEHFFTIPAPAAAVKKLLASSSVEARKVELKIVLLTLPFRPHKATSLKLLIQIDPRRARLKITFLSCAKSANK